MTKSLQNLKSKIRKIISGGQTGVDRAALDVALELGIPCGGWCPQGRRAEDGLIPLRYPLEEASSPTYPLRTELNVQDGDGTLIITWSTPLGGTALTIKLAQKHHKPYLLVDLAREVNVISIREWLIQNKIQVLNIAGPRESEAPGIYQHTALFLKKLFSDEEIFASSSQ
ncbi:MAG: putative molybdenum carrier protein [Thermodesulfobacteriota bacterium]